MSIPSHGSYPQDMRHRYRIIFNWQQDGNLPDHAIGVMLAMLKGRMPDAKESHLTTMANKTFFIVGEGAKFGGELLAIYRHDYYWQVIAFRYDDWADTYGLPRDISLDRDSLPQYSV